MSDRNVERAGSGKVYEVPGSGNFFFYGCGSLIYLLFYGSLCFLSFSAFGGFLSFGGKLCYFFTTKPPKRTQKETQKGRPVMLLKYSYNSITCYPEQNKPNEQHKPHEPDNSSNNIQTFKLFKHL
jgi:hypothetical protein